MKEFKHTKGEWTYSGLSFETGNESPFDVYGGIPSNIPVASALKHHKSFEECEANAKLIAAAPDLLDALINITEVFQQVANGPFEEIDQALKSIDKATK